MFNIIIHNNPPAHSYLCLNYTIVKRYLNKVLIKESCHKHYLLEFEYYVIIFKFIVEELNAENVHHYEKICIRLIAFKAIIKSGEIELKDHEEYVWVQVNKLKGFEFAPADICFVEKLIKLLK
jgi:hypothetical protein